MYTVQEYMACKGMTLKTLFTSVTAKNNNNKPNNNNNNTIYNTDIL